MNTGASANSGPFGQVPYLAINPISTNIPIAKSTTGVNTADNGNMTRGKYTFVTRLAFETRLMLEPLSEEVKYCIGSRPAYTSVGYGVRPEGNFANFPKTMT